MQLFIQIYFFVIGAMIGSFLNVVILRLPRNEDLVFKRSNCPKCQKNLPWYTNIPLLSFLFLRGKCLFCSQKISWRYPLVELISGLMALYLVPSPLTPSSIGFSIWHFAIFSIFLCHFFIDLDHQLLLDKLNLMLLVLVSPWAIYFKPWQYWLIGLALGFGIPYFITWLFYKIKGQIGLGGGDIKLFAILGIMLGPIGVMNNLFLSCMVGAVVMGAIIVFKKLKKDQPLAFGPFIIMTAMVQIYFPFLLKPLKSFLIV